MRKEADDIGPTAELEHWKERMAKFNVYVPFKIIYCFFLENLALLRHIIAFCANL